MPKWEYCTIAPIGRTVTITFLSTTGSEEKKEEYKDNTAAWQGFYTHVAKLGLERWEMVSTAPFYFKRPIEEGETS